MKTRLDKLMHLLRRVTQALVQCGIPVAAGLLEKALFPRVGSVRYEYAVRTFLKHRFCDIIGWYEDWRYAAGLLSAGSPVWVFLSDAGSRKNDELLQTVRIEAGSRPVYRIDRFNYLEYVSLPSTLVKQLSHVSDDMLSDLLCHALLSSHDGTYVDSHTWESSKKGNPVHCFVFDMLAACHAARLPIVDRQLSGIIIRMAEDYIPSVRAERERLDDMIRYACLRNSAGISLF